MVNVRCRWRTRLVFTQCVSRARWVDADNARDNWISPDCIRIKVLRFDADVTLSIVYKTNVVRNTVDQ